MEILLYMYVQASKETGINGIILILLFSKILDCKDWQEQD